jgi:hypothetical protein
MVWDDVNRSDAQLSQRNRKPYGVPRRLFYFSSSSRKLNKTANDESKSEQEGYDDGKSDWEQQ